MANTLNKIDINEMEKQKVQHRQNSSQIKYQNRKKG
jgi:hypothetical protein